MTFLQLLRLLSTHFTLPTRPVAVRCPQLVFTLSDVGPGSGLTDTILQFLHQYLMFTIFGVAACLVHMKTHLSTKSAVSPPDVPKIFIDGRF